MVREAPSRFTTSTKPFPPESAHNDQIVLVPWKERFAWMDIRELGEDLPVVGIECATLASGTAKREGGCRNGCEEGPLRARFRTT
jgi:hypothetical protein